MERNIDLGIITAYGEARRMGYEGTKDEFAEALKRVISFSSEKELYDIIENFLDTHISELLPDMADSDGLYLVQQTDKQMSLTKSQEKTMLEDIGILKDFEGYTDDILGLQIDWQARTCTRLGAAVGLNKGTDFDKFEMFGGRRRCNVADDGTINSYFGDDGYIEDGSNGQVMVYQPKFYYRVVPLKLEKNSLGFGFHVRKANYYISETPKDKFKVFPAFKDKNKKEVPYVLLGAYEGSIYDTSEREYVTDDSQVMNATEDLFCSIANVKPASGLSQNLTRPNIEQMCVNRGEGWHTLNPQFAMIDFWLMMIEHGTPNEQGGADSLGVVSITDQSAYNCSANTGSTNGNASGQATSTTFNIGGTITTETANGKTSYSYRGVENDWGNIWKHIIGLNIWGDGTVGGGIPFICTDFNYAESKKTDNYVSLGFPCANANGYVTAVGYNEEFDWIFIPTETGASSLSLLFDYNYVTVNLNGSRVALLGGAWFNGSRAGLSWYFDSGVGNRYRIIGGRLVYIPTSKEA